MAEIAGNAPLPQTALAPGAAVLDPRALVPAQTGGGSPGGGAAGSAPTPDTSTFDETWFALPPPGGVFRNGIFRIILDEHNKYRPKFDYFREAIRQLTQKEVDDAAQGKPSATNLLETAATLLDGVVSGGRHLPGSSPPISSKPDLKAMRDLMFSDLASGAVGAYDPFTGWWAGKWHSGKPDDDKKRADPYVGFNLHVWDPEVLLPAKTKRDLALQVVQPVTQIDRAADSAATAAWFVSARHLLSDPKCFGTSNYGINVWSPEDDLTGYVWKGPWQGTVPMEKLPHIGFQLAPDVLLWLATVEPSSTVFDSKLAKLYMFLEWGKPRDDFSGAYDIRGAYIVASASWTTSGMSIEGTFSTDPYYVGFNDYAQIAPFPDRESFKKAVAAGLIGKTARQAVTAALTM